MTTEADVLTMPLDTLAAEVERHDRLYWQDDAPEVSDTVYDLMVQRLRDLAPNHPVLGRIGGQDTDGDAGDTTDAGDTDDAALAALPTGAKVRHARPMLSLDKAYTAEEMAKWFERIGGRAAIASHKVDGVAMSLRYDADGRLVLAATRGNGRVGDVITANARRVGDVPHQVTTGPMEVRGEAYMPLDVFESRYAEHFANPRNLTAGALKQKDPAKTEAYGLRFFAYDATGIDGPTEHEKRKQLDAMGFSPVPALEATNESAESVFATLSGERESLNYETDGIVFRVLDVDAWDALGETAHHPRGAIAWKYQGESGLSTLRDIEWSVSRTGAINPVALVEPVSLSGVTVSRVSLHNLNIMDNLAGVGLSPGENVLGALQRGARVLVTRRGGVIPHIEQVAEPGTGGLDVPTGCPSCGAETRREDDVLVADHLDDCAVWQQRQLRHYVSVTDIQGLGPKLLEQLFDTALAREPADLYTLPAYDLAGLDRMGEKSAANVLEQIDRKRTLPLPVFLAALGIPDLGLQVAQLLTAKYDEIDALAGATVEDLVEIDGIGEITAKRVLEGLADPTGRIARLREHVTLEAPEPPPEVDPDAALAGVSFVFTGALASMKRKEAQNRVKALGGDTPSGVSGALDYLVLGDDDWDRFEGGWRSSKLKKAEKLIEGGADLQIISESAFLEMLSKSG